MLTIRFSRTGKKKQPQYRLVISEKHKDPWGNYLELLGNYNPKTKKAELKADRIKYWLSVGAQTSNTVHNLLVKEGIVEGEDKKKKAVRISKKRTAKINKVKEEAEAKAKAEAEAAKPAEEAPKEAEQPAEEVKEE